MIQKTTAFQISDGNTYASLEIAQRAELLKVCTTASLTDEQANPVLQVLFDNLDDVKEILRATGRKARKAKANGAKRTRKLKPGAAEVE